MFKPLKKITLAEEIINTIQDLIASEKLKPGCKLPGERELAEQLCVSRTCVREALRAMSLAGVITIKPGDGTYLNENPSQMFGELLNKKLRLILRENDFLQLMEARKILESQLAKMAAQKVSPEIVAVMEESVKKMEACCHDPEKYVAEDVNFHLAISEAADNTILYQTLSTVRELLTDAQRVMTNDPELIPRSVKQHRQIFECIRDRKAEEVAGIMDEHIVLATKTLQKFIKADD